MVAKSEELKNRARNVANAFASIADSGTMLTGDNKKKALQSYEQKIAASSGLSLEQKSEFFEKLFKNVVGYRNNIVQEMQQDTNESRALAKSFHKLLLEASKEDAVLKHKLEIKRLKESYDDLYKSSYNRQELAKVMFNQLQNEEFKKFIMKYMSNLSTKNNSVEKDISAEDVIFKQMSSTFKEQENFIKGYSNKFLYQGPFVMALRMLDQLAFDLVKTAAIVSGFKDEINAELDNNQASMIPPGQLPNRPKQSRAILGPNGTVLGEAPA